MDCFNGAGARGLRKIDVLVKRDLLVFMLQWGRSTRAPENSEFPAVRRLSIDASMGPEHEGSGKYAGKLPHGASEP